MKRWFGKRRYGPIGVDIGTRSVKLVQFGAEAAQLIEAARWDLPAPRPDELQPADRTEEIAEALRRAREGRRFRGREAVLCLTDRDLSVQNVRAPKTESAADLARLVMEQAGPRLPFPAGEAEMRFIETADVRQGDATLREVIVFACHRPVLERALATIERAGLTPVAVDVEPAALLRDLARQFRRDEDRTTRTLFAHIGQSRTLAVIAEGDEILFLKYLDVGGAQFDEAVAKRLEMTPAEAAGLRKHNGDRRADQQDPEIARSVAEALRPAVERLAADLAMCVRYHNVTFRGKPLSRLLLGGGEATPQLLDTLSFRLDLKGELSDPLRNLQATLPPGRRGQWDVATGLALREVCPA